MLNPRIPIVLFSVVFLAGQVASYAESRKFLVYGVRDANCETEMAHLDQYAIEIQNNRRLKAYVVAYGGRSGTARHEMAVRRRRIKRYLVRNRGIHRNRILIVDGGFREKLEIELWLVPQGESLPKPAPTVSPKQVKYVRAKYTFNCGSFY